MWYDAVIGPIGVNNPYFGDGWVPLFIIPEIFLAEFRSSRDIAKPMLSAKALSSSGSY